MMHHWQMFPAIEPSGLKMPTVMYESRILPFGKNLELNSKGQHRKCHGVGAPTIAPCNVTAATWV